MKIILVLSGLCSLIFMCDSDANHPGKEQLYSSVQHKDTVNFTQQIIPFLKGNCSPCHFQGGKMYENMPFDKEETILRHTNGIVKRLQDKPGVTLLKQFIHQIENEEL